jgi:hypothetical protein
MLLLCREGINHILIGINIIPRNVPVQLIDIFIILVSMDQTRRINLLHSSKLFSIKLALNSTCGPLCNHIFITEYETD